MSTLISAYLTFNGNCEQALRFYESVIPGAKIIMLMRHTGTPAEAHVPAEWVEKIMHGRLALGTQVLMGSDAPPDRYEPAKGISITLEIEDPAAAESVFHALAEGGTVGMPFAETFWAKRFGTVLDRFGIPWMLNCPNPQ